MGIVIDTNVIVAAIVRAGVVRDTLLGHPKVFLAPASCVEEAWDTREDWNRRGVQEGIVREALDLMAKRILVVVPESGYRAKFVEAAGLTADADDIPVVALALSLGNEGIWTFNTRDFSRPELLARVRVLTTGDVRRLLGESS